MYVSCVWPQNIRISLLLNLELATIRQTESRLLVLEHSPTSLLTLRWHKVVVVCPNSSCTSRVSLNRIKTHLTFSRKILTLAKKWAWLSSPLEHSNSCTATPSCCCCSSSSSSCCCCCCCCCVRGSWWSWWSWSLLVVRCCSLVLCLETSNPALPSSQAHQDHQRSGQATQPWLDRDDIWHRWKPLEVS